MNNEDCYIVLIVYKGCLVCVDLFFLQSRNLGYVIDAILTAEEKVVFQVWPLFR